MADLILQNPLVFTDETGFDINPNTETYYNQIKGFGDNRWQVVPIIQELKEKAKSLNIPNFYFSSKKSYAYIIRTVEQLSKIENIIN